jgi:hypothetical protein
VQIRPTCDWRLRIWDRFALPHIVSTDQQ